MTAPVDVAAPPARPRAVVPFVLLALTVLVPALFWFKNSFARRLDDDVLRAFLAPTASATETQHALVELTRRLEEEAAGTSRASRAEAFYPEVVALAAAEGLDGAEKRKAAAWAMQFDVRAAEFRAALVRLLADPAPLVAWNAATSLARHGDAAARPVLLAMLRPYEVRSPVAGAFKPDARLDETLGAGAGSRLAKIETPKGSVELASPVLGRVVKLAASGARVAEGEVVAVVAASQAAAMNALAALALPGIGRPEDVAAVEAFTAATPDLEANVAAQAAATIKALRADNPASR